MKSEISGNTRYSIAGEGPAVVLVHGLGLNRQMWQWQLDSLIPHFKVITYDLLGHGESHKPAGEFKLAHMVAQLADLLNALEVTQCGLVGFSLGGQIVQAFTLAHPDKVFALAILNAAHSRTDEQRAAIMQRVRQVEQGGGEVTASDAMLRWFGANFAARHPEVLASVKEWVISNDRGVYPRLYEMMAHSDIGLETAISAIQCRTIVVTGSEDYGNSPEMAESMAALIPNARAVILPGLRHMALAEDPEAVNSLLVPFLLGTDGL